MQAAMRLTRRPASLSPSSARHAARAAALMAALLAAGPAAAEDIRVTSRVTEATLFPDAASVTRVAKFATTSSGRHVIILEDAPADLNPATLRLRGTAEGGVAFSILGAERGAIRIEPDEAQNTARAKLIQQLDEARRRQRTALDDVQLARERIEYLRQFRSATATPAREGGRSLISGRADWPEAWAAMAKEAKEAQREFRTTENRVREIQKEITRLNRELAFVGPKARTQTVLRITIDAAAPIAAGQLNVTYLTRKARWSPLYDLKLQDAEDGADNGARQVELTRRAAMRQSTGENWRGIRITLSTARPSSRLAGRIPGVVVARIEATASQARLRSGAYFNAIKGQAQTKTRPAVGQLLQDERTAVRDGIQVDRARSEVAPAPAAPREAVEVAADARFEGDRVVYVLEETQNITGDGATAYALIGSDSLEATLEARATPADDRTAYLTAVAKIDKALPPGVASVFRGDTFIGQTRLGYVAPGDKAELPFGAVEGLRIEFETVSRALGAEGSISTKKTLQEQYLVRVTNLAERSYPITIYAAAPVSENDKIKVDFKTDPAPTADRVEGRRGVVAWRFDLGAGEKNEITFGWTISWPDDENIRFLNR